MKIRTVEELQDKLEKDLSWRKKELLSFKLMLKSDEKNPEIFVRAGIALLSAHFEGMIKTAANYYVIYVSCQKISCSDISNNFIALKLKKKITDQCGKTDKTTVHTRLFDKLDELYKQNFYIKYTENSKIIDTQGNPKPEIFKEIIESIGLKYPELELKKNYINHDLLKNRNKIVHGEKTYLTKKDFLDTYDNIMEIIDEFIDIILEAADNESYLKEKQS